MPNQLKHLNLANNSLITVAALSTSNFSSLESLNLAYNKLTTLPTEFIDAIANVYELNLEGNQILAIGSYNKKTIYKWESLNLSHNRFSAVTASTFSSLYNIQSINMNNNTISVIEKNAFSHLTALKLLELEHNQMKEVQLDLPDSVEICTMAHNQILLWPFEKIPSQLSKLGLQNNRLVKLFELDAEIENLRHLNLSDNQLNFLPGRRFANLETLDISYNELTAVPQDLGNRAPNLATLILDHNPIETIDFVDHVSLAFVSLSNMPNLKTLDMRSFKNVVGTKVKGDGNGSCVDITVSHCPMLVQIHENAFAGVELCKVRETYLLWVIIFRDPIFSL
jgi:Leucine-rich repeat (LRR) protein